MCSDLWQGEILDFDRPGKTQKVWTMQIRSPKNNRNKNVTLVSASMCLKFDLHII